MLTKKSIRYYLIFIFVVAMATIFVRGTFSNPQSFELVPKKWYLNPDGEWIIIIEAKNTGSRVDFSSSAGMISNLPVWAFNNENTLKIITKTPTALTVTGRSADGTRVIRIPAPNQQYTAPLQATLTAVGPYMNAIGLAWLGTESIQQWQIWRQAGDDDARLIGYLNATSSSFQDDSVKPNTTYTYKIKAVANSQPVKEVTLSVKTPPPLPAKSLMALAGKGIIVYIDPSDPNSQFYFKKLTPEKIVSHSVQMGCRYIQLRTVYGSYSHFYNKDLLNWLSHLLELANSKQMAVLAWSIPRRDSTNAIAEDIAVAGMRSPTGKTLAGTSLDLETGSDYMGKLPQAKNEIAYYAQTFRKAVGKDYLLSAIVFTPWKSGYTNAIYPYQELAQVSDVMQPMVFWHYYFSSDHHYYSPEEVTNAVTTSVQLIKKFSGRDIPVNVIGQSVDLGNTGIPSNQEINVAMQASVNALAIGISFFAWNESLFMQDNLTDTADAIKNFQW